METFVELSEKERKLIFLRLKLINGKSWGSIIRDLHIGRTMFFSYMSGKSAIPLALLQKIKYRTGTKLSEERLIYKEKYLKKKAGDFKANSELCEILGIL
jgi:hypothetical protein